MFRATRARLLEGARASSVTAARGSMCIVSHRCPREPVHCQSPLPTEGYVHLFRQSPLLKRACASSVTAARGSMCIVGHRCSREHVQPHSVSHRCSREHVHCGSLLPGVARAYLRQSPLLEGACASSPLRRHRSREHVQSPLLEGARAVTAARGACASIAVEWHVRARASLWLRLPRWGARAARSPLLAREFARQGALVRRRPVSALAATAARGSLSICTGAPSPLALREHALREHAAFPDAPCSLGVLWCALEAEYVPARGCDARGHPRV